MQEQLRRQTLQAEFSGGEPVHGFAGAELVVAPGNNRTFSASSLHGSRKLSLGMGHGVSVAYEEQVAESMELQTLKQKNAFLNKMVKRLQVVVALPQGCV